MEGLREVVRTRRVQPFEDRIRVAPPQPDELQRLICIKGTAVEQNKETRLGYAFELAAYELAKDYSLAQAFMASLANVTPEDMQRAYSKILRARVRSLSEAAAKAAGGKPR